MSKKHVIYRRGIWLSLCLIFRHKWKQPFGGRIAFCTRCGARATVKSTEEGKQ